MEILGQLSAEIDRQTTVDYHKWPTSSPNSGKNPILLSEDVDGITLQFWDGKRARTEKYDYVVYGLGMDGSTVDKIQTLLAEMEPIADANQVFGDPNASILGWRSNNGKLLAMGAVASVLQRRLEKAHSFENLLKQIADKHKVAQDEFIKFCNHFQPPLGKVVN